MSLGNAGLIEVKWVFFAVGLLRAFVMLTYFGNLQHRNRVGSNVKSFLDWCSTELPLDSSLPGPLHVLRAVALSTLLPSLLPLSSWFSHAIHFQWPFPIRDMSPSHSQVPSIMLSMLTVGLWFTLSPSNCCHGKMRCFYSLWQFVCFLFPLVPTTH